MHPETDTLVHHAVYVMHIHNNILGEKTGPVLVK